MQRKYGTLMPFGTAIPANANLNTIDYIKVGNYYCSKNADAETLTNSPTESAFMMQVYSPLATTLDNESTGTWVYRFRVMQVYTGARYTQYVYSDGTAGNFSYGAWQLTVESEADGAVGSTTKPVYLSNGKITEGSTYAGGTKVTLNGASKGASTASFYAPTAAGTAGQILKSTAGSPEWASITNSAATLTSGSLVTVANIAGTDITVKLPAATNKIAGATVVYPAAECTTFTSDSGTVTPAAVKKAIGLFVVDGDSNGQIKVNDSNITIYSLPTASSTLGGVKTTSTVTSTSGLTACPIISGVVYYKDTNTTYSAATTSAAGLMSAADKTKLDGIATGANKYSLPTASSSTLGGVKIGTGIGISDGVISNSGVRSVATGSTNGTISVNTNGTAAEVAVKGLGSAAYTSSSNYLSTASGGTVNAQVTVKGNFILRKASWHTISFQNSSGTALATMGMNNTDEAYGKVIIRVYSAASTYSTFSFENDGTFTGTKVKGAVWNDYAEYRQGQKVYQPGTCVIEVGDDTLVASTERLQGGALIVSDTFGFSIGETDKAKTPVATSGRVLAYTFEPRESYLPGDPVCSGPNGTVSKMTEQEVMMYPHKMIGTVSSIPDYEEWGTGKVKVDGRIWIQIR